MKDSFDTDFGKVVIDDDIIARVAGTTALECVGIVGMSSIRKTDGVIRMLTRNSLSKGVKVTFDNHAVALEFHIIVAFGVSMKTVAQNLIENVTYQVETVTGFHVNDIKIYVDGIRMID